MSKCPLEFVVVIRAAITLPPLYNAGSVATSCDPYQNARAYRANRINVTKPSLPPLMRPFLIPIRLACDK